MQRGILLLALGIACVFAFCAQPTNGLVMGIDMGTRFFKVAILRPGAPWHIVLNQESNHKTPTALYLGEDDRQFGSAAQSMAAMRPQDVVLHTPALLGMDYHNTEALHLFQQLQLHLNFVNDTLQERGGFRFKSQHGESSYSMEELTAMLFEHMAAMAAIDAGMPVKDCVINVPAYFSISQRRALVDAARIANLNPMALISDTTAAALYYGIERELAFRTASRHVVFYDMGFTGTKVAIVRFGSRNETTVMGDYHILASTGDPHLGGAVLDGILVNAMIDHFAETSKTYSASDVRASARALAKLRKQAEKLKEVLSANTASSVSIESLMGDDEDLKWHVTREQLELWAEPFLNQVVEPIKDALALAELSVQDIDNVELIGGSVRIPAVQARLKTFFNREKLETSLNGG